MRLFIALELPPAWRAAAAQAQSTLGAHVAHGQLRFVDPGLMHLTLRFLGEVDEASAARLSASLDDELSEVELSLTLGEAGSFGAAARTTVLWLGIGGDREALARLVADVERAVIAAGLGAESRPFRPHITLARVHRSAAKPDREAIAAAVGRVALPEPSRTRFRRVAVVRSYLGGAQPRYEVRSRHGSPSTG